MQALRGSGLTLMVVAALGALGYASCTPSQPAPYGGGVGPGQPPAAGYGPVGPGAATERYCQAHCTRTARCGQGPMEGCLPECRLRTSPFVDWLHPRAIDGLVACVAQSPCTGDDLNCVLLMGKPLEGDVAGKALAERCDARQKQCGGRSDFGCQRLWLAREDLRAAAEPCLNAPCEQIPACIARTGIR